MYILQSMRGHHLNLAKLDATTANLDLVIDAVQILDVGIVRFRHCSLSILMIAKLACRSGAKAYKQDSKSGRGATLCGFKFRPGTITQ